MEVSRQQEQQLRRMGREAVTKAIKAAGEASGGMRRVTAKVTRVNSDYTVDVDMGDSQYAMPITGLRYTTACFGVRVGDTVLVDVVGHLATVTGILATADNGPYVLRGHVSIGAMAQSSYSYVHVSVSFPSAEYVVAVTSSAAGSYWTWASFAVDDKRPDRFTLRYANNSGGTIPDFGMDWVAVWRP